MVLVFLYDVSGGSEPACFTTAKRGAGRGRGGGGGGGDKKLSRFKSQKYIKFQLRSIV